MNAVPCPTQDCPGELLPSGCKADLSRVEWLFACRCCRRTVRVQAGRGVDPHALLRGALQGQRFVHAVGAPAPRMLDLETGGPPDPQGRGPELKTFEGSFVGYRAWKIVNWQLASTGVGIPWPPGINEAACRGHHHLAPHPDCLCGLYALARFQEDSIWWRHGRADVLGAIEAWADVDENNHDRFFVHGTGFRAQYAKVILLATSDEYPPAKNAAIRALAREHGADVCDREHLEAAAMEHGQLVPDDVLEWAEEDVRDRLTAALQKQAAGMLSVGVDVKQATESVKRLRDAIDRLAGVSRPR